MPKDDLYYENNRISSSDMSVDDILAEYSLEQQTQFGGSGSGMDNYGYDDYAPQSEADEVYGKEAYDGTGYYSDAEYAYPADADAYSQSDGESAYYYAGESARPQQDIYSIHSGAIGQMEKDAWEYAASIQSAGYEQYPEDIPAAPIPDFDAAEADYAADSLYNNNEGINTYGEEYDDNSYSAASSSEAQIDSRFNLGGKKKKKGLSFGGKEVDMTADENYSPAEQTGYNPSQWTRDYDDPLAERGEEETGRKKHKIRGFGKKKKKSVEYGEEPEYTPESDGSYAFSDNDAAPSSYAESADYGEYEGSDPERDYRLEDAYVPPSFREYVLSLFASVFFRIRGSAQGDNADTMSDTDEDYGRELSPAEASKYYGSFFRAMRLRFKISLGVFALLCYVSLELPVPGMLRDITVEAAFCFACLCTIMLLSLDVLTTGVMNIFRGRFGVDSLAVLSALASGADALTVALSDTAALHMPLCVLSAFSILGLLLSAMLSSRGLRNAIRVPKSKGYTVSSELKTKSKELTMLKSMHSSRGFVRRCEQAGPDETAYVKLAPLLALLILILSSVLAGVKGCFSDFLYIFSALISPAAPFAAMLSFALPFFHGSARILRDRASIAGWSGLCDIGTAKNLVVTDRDIFPDGSVVLETVRIFADGDANDVISFAGTMIGASGSCATSCFAQLMAENGCTTRKIDDFEYLPGGGMKGIIEGHVVLCGSTELMRLMEVRIPYRITDKTTVLLAIDGILYGIFSLQYYPQPQVRSALLKLMRSTRHPIFAIRDFNVNPEMLHNVFDVATDGYDFPAYVERYEISEPSSERFSDRISAYIREEGLAALTDVADIGHSIYKSVRANVKFNIISSITGVLFVFFRLLIAGCIPLYMILIFMAFWALPVVISSFSVTLYKS